MVVALVKVYANTPAHSIHVSASWFNPFDLSWSSLIDGVLLGIFIYWGWDSGVAVNEESRDRHRGPGQGGRRLDRDPAADLRRSRPPRRRPTTARPSCPTTRLTSSTRSAAAVFGSPLDKLLIIAVLTSASASTQTTILPTARTTLSMARWKAIPTAFGTVHPRFLTPSFSTSDDGRPVDRLDGRAAGVQPQPGRARATRSRRSASRSASTTASPGSRAPVYFRRDLFKSARNFFLAGLIPVVGGLMMGYVGDQGLQLLQHGRQQLLARAGRDPDADPRRDRRPDPRRRADVRIVAVLQGLLQSPWLESADPSVLCWTPSTPPRSRCRASPRPATAR